MIDVAEETLVPIRDVPKRLPPRPGGRRIHISAVYRWIQRGVRGVRLEAVRIGGTTYTSLEALQRFAEQSSNGQQDPPPSFASTATRRRQRETSTRASPPPA